MKFNTKTHAVTLASIFTLAVAGITSLQGCGGGSSSNPPPATTLSWSVPQTKTFHFTWSDISGETEYRLMENPDGVSGYTRVATIAANSTSYDLIVSLPKRVTARYILQSCNSGGCADSNEVTFTSTLVDGIGYFKASNTGGGDSFGISVALSSDGTTLAVGALSEDSTTTGINSTPNDTSTTFNAGAVYLFTHDGTVWSQQAYIKASNAGADDWFGNSVSLSSDGNTLAVGASGEDSGTTGINSTPDEAATNAGAAYVFTRSGNTWTEQAYIKPTVSGVNDYSNDFFGISIALSSDGNTLAVGAKGEASTTTGVNSTPNDLAVDAGAAYVFTRSGSSWSQQAYLMASNAEGGDIFGVSIALSGDGNTLAVGARLEDSGTTGINSNPDETMLDAGAVYVFNRSGTVWSEQAYVKSDNPVIDSGMGRTVSLNSDGNTLAAGQIDPGSVYIFGRSGITWSQQARIDDSNGAVNDAFGVAISLSSDGNTLAVGAPLEDSSSTGINSTADEPASDAGAAYLYRLSGSSWTQQAYIKAYNTEAGDTFGDIGFALSGDGDTLAVGVASEDSITTGINSIPNDTSTTFDSGAVYLY